MRKVIIAAVISAVVNCVVGNVVGCVFKAAGLGCPCEQIHGGSASLGSSPTKGTSHMVWLY
jgi:hypothetical protein